MYKQKPPRLTRLLHYRQGYASIRRSGAAGRHHSGGNTMRYPTLGANAGVAFILALDITMDGETPFVAITHSRSQLRQFGRYWPQSVIAVLDLKLAKKLVIVGGYEDRYTDRQISRPEMLKEIVLRTGTVDEKAIECVHSDPNTIGNAKAIAEWCQIHQYDHDDAFICCQYWHEPRALLDMLRQGIDLPLIPLEAVLLAAAHSRRLRQRELHDQFGGGDFAMRAVMECNGIADKLCRQFRPLSQQPEQQTAVA